MSDTEKKSFHCGDVVQLRSGGLSMTVVRVLHPRDTVPFSEITCCWLDVRGVPHSESFPDFALQEY